MSTGEPDSCKRELVIEVPADAVQREVEKITRGFQRQARVPGFRPGKTPISIIRGRFGDDIRREVLQHLIPEYFSQRTREENLEPISGPDIQDVKFDLEGAEPLRFKASFEVIPSFELAPYQDLEIEVEEPAVTDEEVDTALKQLREQAATYAAVEDRPLEDGDFALISMQGKQVAAEEAPGGETAASQKPGSKAQPGGPVQVDDILCEIAGADTLPAFSANLRGAAPGEERVFPVSYPENFSDQRLAGRTLEYTVKVSAVKHKQVPELNDDFAKDLGPFQTLEEVRAHVRTDLLEQKRRRSEQDAKEKLIARLVELNSFPVPESLVEKQLQTRLERTVRQLAAQGVNAAKLDLDWAKLRASQREGVVRDVQAGLILERIAEREGLEVSEEDIRLEVEQLLRQQSGKDAAAMRARLTRPEVTDKIKNRLRSEKSLDFVYRNARKTASPAAR